MSEDGDLAAVVDASSHWVAHLGSPKTNRKLIKPQQKL